MTGSQSVAGSGSARVCWCWGWIRADLRGRWRWRGLRELRKHSGAERAGGADVFGDAGGGCGENCWRDTGEAGGRWSDCGGARAGELYRRARGVERGEGAGGAGADSGGGGVAAGSVAAKAGVRSAALDAHRHEVFLRLTGRMGASESCWRAQRNWQRIVSAGQDRRL